MAPTPGTLMSSGSKKKEPRYVCLSEAKYGSYSANLCETYSHLHIFVDISCTKFNPCQKNVENASKI